MATQLPLDNDTGTYKEYAGVTDFSGVVQNKCDYPSYLFIGASAPADGTEGIILAGGVGQWVPVNIPDGEKLFQSPIFPGNKTKIQAG